MFELVIREDPRATDVRRALRVSLHLLPELLHLSELFHLPELSHLPHLPDLPLAQWCSGGVPCGRRLILAWAPLLSRLQAVTRNQRLIHCLRPGATLCMVVAHHGEKCGLAPRRGGHRDEAEFL